MGVGAAAVVFAVVNTYVLTPNTLIFRERSAADAPAAMQTPVHVSFGGLFELLGSFVLIRGAIEDELEQAFAGQKSAQSALDAAVERGNKLLRQFERASPER